jgi:BT1 family
MSETSQPPTSHPAPIASARAAWIDSFLRPILAFRLSYVPVVMVYFAYGALGLIDVTRDFWIKEQLQLSPSDLASIGVWLTLPWTIKMVFGELVDCVPIFGSQRRVYISIGALFTASGLVTLAGAAGGWLTFMRPDQLYVLGALLIVLGTVIQDVVADAMSTEVVSRFDASGAPKPEHEVRSELGMVQVIGRLSLSAGIVAVAGLSGVLASFFTRETVFLMGLVIPAVSLTGMSMIEQEKAAPRPIDWRILGGGIVFGGLVLSLALGGIP